MAKCTRILNNGKCNGEMEVIKILEGGKIYKCKKCGTAITTNVNLENLDERD